MAEKLSIQIALEGGKEIEKQLEGIGKAGEKAFGEIVKAAEQVGGFKNLNPEFVTEKLREMGVTGKDAVDKIQAAVQQAAKLETFTKGVQTLEKAFGKLGLSAEETKQALLRLREAGKLESVIANVQKLQGAFLAFSRVIGPIAIAAVAAGTAIHNSMTSAAEAINQVNAAAQKMGVPIEKFDALRLALEKAGLSGKEVTGAIGQVQSAFDKVQVDKATTALRQLEEAAARGFGPVGTEQLRTLNELARQVGPGADAARAALVKLGQPIPAGPADALKRLGIEATSAADFTQKLIEKLQTMPDSAQRTALAIAGLGDVAGPKFIEFLRQGGSGIDLFVEKERLLTAQTAQMASELVLAQNLVATAFSRFSTDPSLANFGALAKAAFTEIGVELRQAITPLVEFSNKLDAAVWQAFKDAGTAALNAVSGAIAGATQTMNDLIKATNDAIARLAELLAAGQQVGQPGGGGGGGGHARGGFIGGRGSGTSDSNLAWVSRGEHIMPARAVRQPGVLAFLEALRRSGGNLGSVLDRMSHFALGGMVARPSPVPAGVGGTAAAHRDLGTVRLVLPDGVMVSGLADAKIVEALGRAAVKAQVRSGGRKPSRYT
jgi:hypothetical protein